MHGRELSGADLGLSRDLLAEHPEAAAPVQYGPRRKSVAVYLKEYHNCCPSTVSRRSCAISSAATPSARLP